MSSGLNWGVQLFFILAIVTIVIANHHRRHQGNSYQHHLNTINRISKTLHNVSLIQGKF